MRTHLLKFLPVLLLRVLKRSSEALLAVTGLAIAQSIEFILPTCVANWPVALVAGFGTDGKKLAVRADVALQVVLIVTNVEVNQTALDIGQLIIHSVLGVVLVDLLVV